MALISLQYCTHKHHACACDPSARNNTRERDVERGASVEQRVERALVTAPCLWERICAPGRSFSAHRYWSVHSQSRAEQKCSLAKSGFPLADNLLCARITGTRRFLCVRVWRLIQHHMYDLDILETERFCVRFVVVVVQYRKRQMCDLPSRKHCPWWWPPMLTFRVRCSIWWRLWWLPT